MCKRRELVSSFLTAGALIVAGMFGGASFTGCERKERVLDVETPSGQLEVNRNVDSGAVEVEVEEK
jgi:hypothetical protein